MSTATAEKPDVIIHIEEDLSAIGSEGNGFGELGILVRPAKDGIISGTVDVLAFNANLDTEIIAFGITGGNIAELKDSGPNIGIDTNGTDGWTQTLDTTKYENGEYRIFAVGGKNTPGELPTSAVNLDLIIEN